MSRSLKSHTASNRAVSNADAAGTGCVGAQVLMQGAGVAPPKPLIKPACKALLALGKRLDACPHVDEVGRRYETPPVHSPAFPCLSDDRRQYDVATPNLASACQG